MRARGERRELERRRLKAGRVQGRAAAKRCGAGPRSWTPAAWRHSRMPGWQDVLTANPNARLSLDHEDWSLFFSNQGVDSI